jgi:hypothetical protein
MKDRAPWEAAGEAAKIVPSPTPAEIDEHNENVRQWRAVCQVCGVPLVGTLKQIRAHQHPPKE